MFFIVRRLMPRVGNKLFKFYFLPSSCAIPLASLFEKLIFCSHFMIDDDELHLFYFIPVVV
jgi:hypothetical protein